MPTDPNAAMKTGANLANTGKNMIPGGATIPNMSSSAPIPIPGVPKNPYPNPGRPLIKRVG